MRIARVLYALLLVLALSAVAAFGATPVTLDPSTGCGPLTNTQDSGGGCIEPTVTAYGGWVAWSHLDPATDNFQLALRDPQGTELAAPVAERKTPFDVSLGPSAHGVVAVYSRCTDEVNLLGCAIVELQLAGIATTTPLASGSTGASGASGTGEPAGVTAPEIALTVPLSGSLHAPAIWNNRLVFLRRDRIYSWTIGAHKATELPFPSSDGNPGLIGGLSLNGTEVAYTTSPSGAVVIQGLWVQTLGRAPRFIEGITVGQGAECASMFLSPIIVGSYLYAFHQDCDQFQPKRWERYSLKSTATYRADVNFQDGADNEIHSVVPDRGGVTWISPVTGAVLHLANFPWKSVTRKEVHAIEREGCTLRNGC
ncbi:MAG: hypothetical protein WBQ21_05625 [Solirubrobacteraceae bacterium]